ncbi:MAG: multidrug transporter [Erythrobacter sp. SCN 62-14]|nr:MAG: multidrug transporter [Erythrobacter sp. SCN 62-14]
MASAPQPTLPLFYNDLIPLNSRDHTGWKVGPLENAAFMANTHAIPLTVEEFIDAQRNFPIVFTVGENPVPIALMGLNEGVNTFMGDDHKLTENVYLPAYARRYPFMLARLTPDSDDLSLCFDPSVKNIGKDVEGEALFTPAGEPTENTQRILDFCRQFEEAGHRTQAFMKLLDELDIMMDGEVAITQADKPDTPFVYRGFRMVDEAKLRDLPADKLDMIHKNGMIMLIHAHLFSLNLMRSIFERQALQGKVPTPAPAA